jgi:hypothetical protein
MGCEGYVEDLVKALLSINSNPQVSTRPRPALKRTPYVEDRNDPDEEVLAPVSSIGACSTALMFMLTDCTDSLVDDDDSSASACAAASAAAILAGDHDLAIVHSIGFTLLVELRLTRKSLPRAGFLRQPESRLVKNYYTLNRLVWV